MWNSRTKYHPRIGYTYLPNVKSRLLSERGGYLVRTNAAGFRSDREFAKFRTAGKFRAILFGDSQTSGDGNSSADRYGDVLEQLVPSLEVFNYGLSGTGTDQQYLTYLDCADVEHDLVIVGIYVENIERVAKHFQVFEDDRGNEVIYAKPYYVIEGGQLALRHVPVPKGLLTRDMISTEDAAHVNWRAPYAGLRKIARNLGIRDLVRKFVRHRLLPQYDAPDHPEWLLLRKILETWIRGSDVPVLLFLVPTWPHIEGSCDAASYQRRFRELASETGCYLHDPLADLWKHSAEERRTFYFEHDAHLSPAGHRALAASLAVAVREVMACCPAPR